MCILYGRGDGTFERQQLPLNVPSPGARFVPGQAEVVQLNEDPIPDVVVGNTNLSSGGVTVFLGQGNRSFVRVDQPAFGGTGTLEQLTPLSAGDGGLVFGLLLGSRDRFSIARILPDAGVVNLAASGDLFPTFAPAFKPSVTALLWQTSQPGHESVITFETTERINSTIVFSRPGRLRRWSRDGGGFEPLADWSTPAPPMAGGVNGAAMTDEGFVFSTRSSAGPSYRLGFGDGGSVEPFTATAHGLLRAAPVVGSGLDVVLYGEDQRLRVYDAVDGGFETWSEVAQLPPHPNGLAIADFDEDGRADIVVLGNGLGDNRFPFMRLLLQKR